jgi:hypothetical protein
MKGRSAITGRPSLIPVAHAVGRLDHPPDTLDCRWSVTGTSPPPGEATRSVEILDMTIDPLGAANGMPTQQRQIPALCSVTKGVRADRLPRMLLPPRTTRRGFSVYSRPWRRSTSMPTPSCTRADLDMAQAVFPGLNVAALSRVSPEGRPLQHFEIAAADR